MIDLRFTPIDKWPQEPTKQRRSARFAASSKVMYDDLETEMNHLGARDITVQGYFTRQQIRNDGWPYSNAAPSAPGVILSFESNRGPMRWACDTFTHWEQNLRAIGLTLHRLRLIDEYGCSKKGEQYKGWQQLPPGASESRKTVEEACRWLASLTGVVITASSPKEAYIEAKRAGAKLCHPDAGGTKEKFMEFNENNRVLDEHFGRAA